MATPFVSHWQGLRRIFCYLQGTKHLVLQYGGPNATTKLVGYSDADYVGCLESRHSIGGYAFLLGGAPITWSSKKQSNVAGSTMEAEYTTIRFFAREEFWFSKAYEDYAIKLDVSIVINEDNQACIAIAKDPSYHGCAKHFDVHVHFVRH